MKKQNFNLAKFKLSIYELETVLSMSPLYHIEHAEIVSHLEKINESLKNLHENSTADIEGILEDFPRIQSAFKTNKIEIYTTK